MDLQASNLINLNKTIIMSIFKLNIHTFIN